MNDDQNTNAKPESSADDQPAQPIKEPATPTTSPPEGPGLTDAPETDKAVDEVQHSDSDAELEAAFAPKPIIVGKPSLWQRYLDHKKWTIPVTVLVVVLLVIFGQPTTRYKALGLVLKRQYTLTLVDSSTHKPVSGAVVTVSSLSATTDGNGKAVLKSLSVGPKVVKVSKQYYQAYSGKLFVGVSGANQTSLSLVATGRQVHIIVVNKVTGKGIAGADITAAGTTAKTDSNGEVQMVLPADKNTTQAHINVGGYNAQTVTIQITTQEVSANKIQLIPSGKVYFLSNQSGTIDVVSTNYDGTNRQAILTGTGHENGYGTELIPSPDQKYLALIARRTTAPNGIGLYIINTSNNKMFKAEEVTNGGIGKVDWAGNYFVYEVQDFSKDSWVSGQALLKSYNTATASSQTLDQTLAEGTSTNDYASQLLSATAVIDGSVVYAKGWTASYNNTSRLSGKRNTIYTVQPSGSNKKSLRDFDIPGGSTYSTIYSSLAGPHTMYLAMPTNSSGDLSQGAIYYKYTKGTLTQLNNFTYGDFSNPNLLNGFASLSPSGNATLFSDSVDGHLVVSVGDEGGDNKQKVITLPTDGEVKGWLTDNYVLVTQNTNKLYVVPASPSSGAQALQVSDFYVLPQGHD